jgi:hypothetical protein
MLLATAREIAFHIVKIAVEHLKAPEKLRLEHLRVGL